MYSNIFYHIGDGYAMENMTLEELATAVKQGNKDLLPILWERTQRLIKKIILKYVNNKRLPNSVELDDLFQSGYFALLQAVRAYNSDKPYKFSTYLNYHIFNIIQDVTGTKHKHLKEVSYNKPVTDKDGGTVELLDLIADETGDSSAELKITEPVEQADTQRIVIEAVNELPPVQREVIDKHYLQGFTLGQIAAERQCTIENVRQYERKAMKTLRRKSKLRKLYFDTVGMSCIHYFSSFEYSPEYFEVTRRIEELERQCTAYMTYGKRQAQRLKFLMQAEKEYNQRHNIKGA